MKRACKRTALLALLILAGGGAAAWAEAPLFESAEAGDLVLIGEAGLWTDIAEGLSTGDRRYGHVGILVGSPGDWRVIDAGGPILDDGAGVTERPLASFLGKARRVGLYRANLNSIQRKALIAEATRAAADALPFDKEWRLDTEDAVYCTEFVWRALNAATGEESVPSRTVIAGVERITLGDLVASPLLVEVAATRRE